eukprot:8521033-Pyramimonas_sp.AAC.1
MKDLGFRAEFVDIETRSHVVYGVWEELEEARGNLEQIRSRRHKGWNETSFAGRARKTRQRHLGPPVRLIRGTSRLQQKLYIEFRAAQQSEP